MRRPGASHGAALAFAAMLGFFVASCDENPYHAVGCTTTTPFPAMGRGAPDRGVVCVSADSATDAPPCAKVAEVYRVKEHPVVDFGVIVHRRSRDESECTGVYSATGQRMSDLSVN